MPTDPSTLAASAFAAAVCRWHHAHNGQPVPCVQADREAAALTGLLEHAGYRLTAATEFCAARGCPNAAIWASPVIECSGTFLVPVCREHGTPLSPIHGVVSLDNFMRHKPDRAEADS